MNLKRLLLLLGVAFAVFFVVEAPGEAARLVKATGESLGEWLSAAATAFSKFFRSLI